jgi:DNA-binding CsgD family transcriptional regulator
VQESLQGDVGLERFAMLDQARRAYRAGLVSEAWEACAAAAEMSRRVGDAASFADAATVIRAMHNAPVTARVNAMCAEALVRLGDTDPVRTARVRAQLVATMSPSTNHQIRLDLNDPGDDPEAVFLSLQARHAELQHPGHVGDRLMLGDQAVELGTRTGVLEYACWGRRWRMGAYAELGNRLDLVNENAALRAMAEGLPLPAWEGFLTLVDASQHLMDGRFDEAQSLVENALRAAGPGGEAQFFSPVFAFAIARMTGRGLDDVRSSVQATVDRLPFLARGWTCRVLMAAGHREETALLWRSISAHADRLPDRLPEWLIATVGHAEVCAWLGDVEFAAPLYYQLLPYEGHMAMTMAQAPFDGPVALQLGKLAALLGRFDDSRRHLQAALATCEALNSPPFVAMCHAELARLHGLEHQQGRTHAQNALRIARRLGMRPLIADLQSAVAKAEPTTLTAREGEVCGLLAEGLTNMQIARRLTLSERTVETHISHALHKTGNASRVALARWYLTHTD